MPEIYEIIDDLCQRKRVSGSKMCAELGLSRSTLTELRKGRAKTVTLETAMKIAGYFDVSLDYLWGKNQEPGEPGNPSGDVKLPLKSIARIEGNNITPEEDAAISAFVDFLMAERDKEKGE